MQAMVIRGVGDAAGLHLEEVPNPRPGPREVLVAVKAPPSTALISPSAPGATSNSPWPGTHRCGSPAGSDPWQDRSVGRSDHAQHGCGRA